MPKINKPIKFSADSLIVINEKKSSKNFNHTDWGHEDLEFIRAEIRNHYRTEQKLECVYCLEPIGVRAAQSAPIEHIVPKSQYLCFIFEPKNLCVVCADCNEYKGSNEVLFNPVITGGTRVRYPTASKSFRIFHPHIDDYEEHILKVNRVYLDRTQKGHYTIGICKLNRFFHYFGMCDEFVNDAKIAEENENFFKNGKIDTNDILNNNNQL